MSLAPEKPIFRRKKTDPPLETVEKKPVRKKKVVKVMPAKIGGQVLASKTYGLIGKVRF